MRNRRTVCLSILALLCSFCLIMAVMAVGEPEPVNPAEYQSGQTYTLGSGELWDFDGKTMTVSGTTMTFVDNGTTYSIETPESDYQSGVAYGDTAVFAEYGGETAYFVYAKSGWQVAEAVIDNGTDLMYYTHFEEAVAAATTHAATYIWLLGDVVIDETVDVTAQVLVPYPDDHSLTVGENGTATFQENVSSDNGQHTVLLKDGGSIVDCYGLLIEASGGHVMGDSTDGTTVKNTGESAVSITGKFASLEGDFDLATSTVASHPYPNLVDIIDTAASGAVLTGEDSLKTLTVRNGKVTLAYAPSESVTLLGGTLSVDTVSTKPITIVGGSAGNNGHVVLENGVIQLKNHLDTLTMEADTKATLENLGSINTVVSDGGNFTVRDSATVKTSVTGENGATLKAHIDVPVMGDFDYITGAAKACGNLIIHDAKATKEILGSGDNLTIGEGQTDATLATKLSGFFGDVSLKDTNMLLADGVEVTGDLSLENVVLDLGNAVIGDSPEDTVTMANSTLNALGDGSPTISPVIQGAVKGDATSKVDLRNITNSSDVSVKGEFQGIAGEVTLSDNLIITGTNGNKLTVNGHADFGITINDTASNSVVELAGAFNYVHIADDEDTQTDIDNGMDTFVKVTSDGPLTIEATDKNVTGLAIDGQEKTDVALAVNSIQGTASGAEIAGAGTVYLEGGTIENLVVQDFMEVDLNGVNVTSKNDDMSALCVEGGHVDFTDGKVENENGKALTVNEGTVTGNPHVVGQLALEVNGGGMAVLTGAEIEGNVVSQYLDESGDKAKNSPVVTLIGGTADGSITVGIEAIVNLKDNVIATGAVTLNGAFTAEDTASVHGDVNLKGTLTMGVGTDVAGTITGSGEAVLDNDAETALEVNGSFTTLDGNVNMVDNLTMGAGTATITGSEEQLTINGGTATVTGLATDITVQGETTIANVGGTFADMIVGDSTVNLTATSGDSLAVSGIVNVNDNLMVTGLDIEADGTLNVAEGKTLTAPVTLKGEFNVAAGGNVDGVLTASNEATLNNASETALQVQGALVTLDGKVATAGDLVITTGETNAAVVGTADTTHDLTIKGGTVGVGGEFGTLTVENGTVTVQDATQGTVNIQADGICHMDAVVTGNVAVTGTLNVAESGNVTGTVEGTNKNTSVLNNESSNLLNATGTFKELTGSVQMVGDLEIQNGIATVTGDDTATLIVGEDATVTIQGEFGKVEGSVKTTGDVTVTDGAATVEGVDGTLTVGATATVIASGTYTQATVEDGGILKVATGKTLTAPITLEGTLENDGAITGTITGSATAVLDNNTTNTLNVTGEFKELYGAATMAGDVIMDAGTAIITGSDNLLTVNGGTAIIEADNTKVTTVGTCTVSVSGAADVVTVDSASAVTADGTIATLNGEVTMVGDLTIGVGTATITGNDDLLTVNGGTATVVAYDTDVTSTGDSIVTISGTAGTVNVTAGAVTAQDTITTLNGTVSTAGDLTITTGGTDAVVVGTASTTHELTIKDGTVGVGGDFATITVEDGTANVQEAVQGAINVQTDGNCNVDAAVTGDITVAGTADIDAVVTGNVTVTGTLTVSTNGAVTGTITGSGDAVLDNNLETALNVKGTFGILDGKVTMADNLTMGAGTATITGCDDLLTVKGGTATVVANDTDVTTMGTSTVSISGAADVVTVTAGAVMAEDTIATLNGTVSTAEDLTITAGGTNALVVGTDITHDLTVDGGTVGIKGDFGTITVGNGTDLATLKIKEATQGSLVVNAQAVAMVDDVFTGNITANGTANIDATVTGNLTVSGTATIDATITGTVNVSGTMTLKGDGVVTGLVTANNATLVAQGTAPQVVGTVSSFKGEVKAGTMELKNSRVAPVSFSYVADTDTLGVTGGTLDVKGQGGNYVASADDTTVHLNDPTPNAITILDGAKVLLKENTMANGITVVEGQLETQGIATLGVTYVDSDTTYITVGTDTSKIKMVHDMVLKGSLVVDDNFITSMPTVGFRYASSGWYVSNTKVDVSVVDLGTNVVLETRWIYPVSSGGGASAGIGSALNVDEQVEMTQDRQYITFQEDMVNVGDEVSFSVKDKVGYFIGSITVTNKNQKTLKVTTDENGLYHFDMPADKVALDVEYVPYYTFAQETPPVVTAELGFHVIYLNGEIIPLATYNINGNNYAKLRDVAMALNGTASQFEISYVETQTGGVIHTTPGQAYTPVGGEGVLGEDGSDAAVASTWTLVSGGITRYLKTYNINDNNYFQLRELGDLLGFDVDFDLETQAVVMKTPEAKP